MTNSDSIVVTPGTELPFACASCFLFLIDIVFVRARERRTGVGWLD
jgi:hypothetical protein